MRNGFWRLSAKGIRIRKSDLTLDMVVVSGSLAFKQLAVSSRTSLSPHVSCRLCHAAQALASGNFSVLKCLEKF